MSKQDSSQIERTISTRLNLWINRFILKKMYHIISQPSHEK